MTVTSVPFGRSRPSSISPYRLQQIADVLGLPVDAFTAAAQSHILHTSENGTCWLLTIDTWGLPVVRCMRGSAAGQQATEESILSFLTRDPGTPQHRALIALVDHLLTRHLAG
jgi:hypothetical protein